MVMIQKRTTVPKKKNGLRIIATSGVRKLLIIKITTTANKAIRNSGLASALPRFCIGMNVLNVVNEKLL